MDLMEIEKIIAQARAARADHLRRFAKARLRYRQASTDVFGFTVVVAAALAGYLLGGVAF
jgi:hypothetical protein